MTTQTEHPDMIQKFGEHYQYDTTYMRHILETHPQAFGAFAAFLPMARFRETLPEDVYFVAKLAAMQVADCSACLQLNVRMALEAGLEGSLIEAVLKEGELPEHLAAVDRFARQVARHEILEDEAVEAMRQNYGDTGLIELALGIASTSVFPMIKRSFGMVKSCHLVDVSI